MPHRWSRTLRRRAAKGGGARPLLLTVLLGVLLALGVIACLQVQLRPIVERAAQAQAVNLLTRVVDEAAAEALSQHGSLYAQYVTIVRDQDGGITAVTADMAALNRLRIQVADAALAALEGVDVSEIAVPVGSVFGSELLWARGPSLKARAMRVGTVSAEFRSDFSAAGVNQTLHRVVLEVRVPLTILLPGGPVEAQVDTELCAAETVIVGKVPDTYLNINGKKEEDPHGAF